VIRFDLTAEWNRSRATLGKVPGLWSLAPRGGGPSSLKLGGPFVPSQGPHYVVLRRVQESSRTLVGLRSS
jgi:hypothetical protein